MDMRIVGHLHHRGSTGGEHGRPGPHRDRRAAVAGRDQGDDGAPERQALDVQDHDRLLQASHALCGGGRTQDGHGERQVVPAARPPGLPGAASGQKVVGEPMDGVRDHGLPAADRRQLVPGGGILRQV
ncbi:hypothetical protein [Streptomyces ardesiacus]|uniref:hypothetical protein n=1 Tax=Streptomyces ardesiacus TaxID=285564 RepID=UPI0036E41339